MNSLIRRGRLWACAFLLIMTRAAMAAAPPPAPGPVRLPVEVMGANNTVQTVSVNVTGTPAVTGLWMQAHGLTYINKASVQVNGGAWIPLNNTTAAVEEPGKSFGGIAGAFATLKMTVPLAAGSVHAGVNTVSFRFNATDGVSIGFRILAFNFVTATGQTILPASAFVQDDPSTWTAPRPAASDIAAGKSLWHTAVLVKSGVDNTPILATCSDCHSEDGRDLKYFSYSNYSIIQRARFHGLNETQAEQIASYIRSLPVSSPGRPWNPPYQPGPGTDSKPVAAWAAGAGVGGVLAHDADMLTALFPNGINKNAADTRGTLNLRELPIALPLPDWNHWLPKIHPKDAWGAAFVNSPFAAMYDGEGTSHEPNGALRQRLMATDPVYHKFLTNQPDAQVMHLLQYWQSKELDFIQARQTPPSGVWTNDYADKLYSTALWRLVKEWEFNQEFALEGNGPTIYGAGGEARTWLAGAAFAASPAMLGLPKDGKTLFTPTQYEYFTNAWYYTQAVLNSGNRHRYGWGPIDWGYAKGRISDLSRVTHVPEYLRMTAMSIKAMQQSDTIGKVDTTFGWFPVWTYDALQYTYHDHGYGNGYILDEMIGPNPLVSANVKAQVEQAVTAAWFDKMQQFPAQQYYDAGLASPTDQQDARYNLYNSVYGIVTPYAQGYTSLAQEGVDPRLVDAIADWAKTLWPTTNWDRLKP